MAPKFTILLAVVRPPLLLPFAIKSVFAQTVEEFELFIVCDGAPPETIEYAQELARRDPRVKAFVFPKGERFGEAHWHEVLSTATGRYVAHLEDDDLWFPNHLEELEELLRTVDFGHLMHVFAQSDDNIEMLSFDVGRPELRQRMLAEKFNGFGFTVCGYRLDAYRRLAEGWAPGPKGMWPDLNMWRKFLGRDDLKFGARMVVTALVLANGSRRRLSLEERAGESRKWLGRIFDEREREKIEECAWRSVVHRHLHAEHELGKNIAVQRELHAEIELLRQAGTERGQHFESELGRSVAARRELQAEFERMLNSISWRVTKPLRSVGAALKNGFLAPWRR